MILPTTVSLALQHAINAALRLDQHANPLVSKLDQKVIRVHLSGIDLDVYLFAVDGSFQVSGIFDGEVDTTISGTPLAIAGLSRNAGRLFAGDVRIEGDMSVGRKLKRLIADLDIDWEEQLSQVVGDAAAHKIGNLHRRFTDIVFTTFKDTGQSASEYLTEESRLLVTPLEVRKWMDQVDDIRSDTDRLQARIDLLDQALGERR